MTSIVVVGSSLAGLRAAETLRAEGYDGELTLIGEETHLPYDRPALSKDFLAGKTGLADIELASRPQLDALDATWILGEPATGLDTRGVHAGGHHISADGVVVATGARARTLTFGQLQGVHTFRTVDDALALRQSFQAGAQVVVIGAGFIGTELAYTAVTLGCHVTLVESGQLPLSPKLGRSAAELLRLTITEHGVDLRTETSIDSIEGTDRVTAVVLSDGERVPADVVIVGVGATPNVEWLHGSAVNVTDGVCTDEWGRTSMPHVVAAGDVACVRRPAGQVRAEHWTNARDMPVVAALTLLADLTGRPAPQRYDPVPYFWSEQFGTRIQLAGTIRPNLEFVTVEGSLADRQFVAVQREDGIPCAILGWNMARPFVQWRRRNEAVLRHSVVTNDVVKDLV